MEVLPWNYHQEVGTALSHCIVTHISLYLRGNDAQAEEETKKPTRPVKGRGTDKQ